MFSGYFGLPESLALQNGWFHMGDLGYYDEEGFLFVTGRKKEMLKFNNFQVTPSELEEIINKIEGVVESCVVGVQQKDTGNDTIYAFVQVDESKTLTEKFVKDYVDERVIDAKRIRGGVHFIKEFEMTPSGKVSKPKMKKIALDLENGI
jgi:acyl-coenzyme A synthetase/AMP-(fatty) acid ligase